MSLLKIEYTNVGTLGMIDLVLVLIIAIVRIIILRYTSYMYKVQEVYGHNYVWLLSPIGDFTC